MQAELQRLTATLHGKQKFLTLHANFEFSATQITSTRPDVSHFASA